MPRLTVRVSLGLVLALMAGVGTTVFGQRRAAWPPPVQKVPAIAPALSAEDELKTFYLPPGYHVEIVASDPLVQDPIAMDYDPDGRLFVLEMPGFAPDKTMVDSHEPTGRVVMLEDTNNDGRMDKRTVFMDGLVLPRALKVTEHGVLVGSPPNLWLARDTDGDGKADTKELVHGDFGRADGNLEHNANSLYWGLDNGIYTSEHDWCLRYKDGKFEVVNTLSRGQWGVSQDDAGRLYRNVNTEALFVDLVPARYFVRNPNIIHTRGLYERLVDPDKTAIWPVRPTPGINRGYREGLLRRDGTAAYYAGVSSPVIYRGDRLPKDLAGNAFVVDSPTNLVHRLIVQDDGTGRLSAHDAYEKGEFLASTDERFRPVNIYSGPDGVLDVVDMYRGVVQDVGFQTEYLKDYIVKHQLELPVGKGRIFRIVHDTTRRDKKPALSKETPAGLVAYLSHPNGWWRDTAQQLLVERGDRSVAPALTQLARQSPDYRTRLHALWTLDGLDAIEPASVLAALEDQTPDVRVSALRLAERWLHDPARPGASASAGAGAAADASGSTSASAMQAAVLAKIDDANWQVRWQVAATIGELPAPARVDPLVTLLGRFGNDEILVDAAISGLRGQESAVLTRLLDIKSTETRLDGAIAMLAGAIMKGSDAPGLQQVMAAAADDGRPQAQRLALLRGLDAALSGGANRGNGGAAPSGATGRATMAAGSPGAGILMAPPPAQPTVRFVREPTQLTQLATGSGELGDLAKRVTARIWWPNKPTPALTPLTAAEQTRYDAGSTIYKNICINCHQPDGQGKEHLAPTLVGSRFALANPVVPVRILLAGKEGNVGLMPPLSTLTDDQIASVLTYVRREWGNGGTAVDPAIVKEIRALTASHTRPWTEPELSRLATAGRPGG